MFACVRSVRLVTSRAATAAKRDLGCCLHCNTRTRGVPAYAPRRQFLDREIASMLRLLKEYPTR